MRLRSSQFVFLLLIACSVQIREERALRWVEQAISGDSGHAFPVREASATAGRPNSPAAQPIHRLASLDLFSAALAARREPWMMRWPASDSTAIAAHTGLLRV